MEAFIIIFSIVIAAIILHKTLSEKLDSINSKIDGLYQSLRKQENKLSELQQQQTPVTVVMKAEEKQASATTPSAAAAKPEPLKPEVIIQTTPSTSSSIQDHEPLTNPQITNIMEEKHEENEETRKEESSIFEEFYESHQQHEEPETEPIPAGLEYAWAATSASPGATIGNTGSGGCSQIPSTPPADNNDSDEPKPSFFERHPDLEKFIGENIINKIGIGILVLGIGYFVKYAIDKEWINEIGRVLIGLLCGGILIGVAHKLRKNFKPFSSVLVGGGLAVFYLTISIAFHQYHLMGQTAAFLVMAVITAFAIILSITYDRQELAVLAIIGGFSTPFMVSTGSGNYVVLFTYLMILNVGMLVLGYFKKWNLLNIICYVFTVIIYGGWLTSKVIGEPNAPYFGALVFATLFYLVFFLMNIINNIKENRKFISLEISLILSITFLYYSAGMMALQYIQNGMFQGLFTALTAVFNFAFAYTLYKNNKVDKNLLYLLIGLVLTFLSLTAPVQLDGNYITLFWATEAVMLLWLSQKSGIKIIKLASAVVLALMHISLFMDWGQLYMQEKGGILAVIFNKAFITSVFSIASVFAYIRLLKNETEDYFLTEELPVKVVRNSLKVVLAALAYAACMLELRYQLDYLITFPPARHVFYAMYNFAWIVGILLAGQIKQDKYLKIGGTVLGLLGILSVFGFYHFSFVETRNAYLFNQLSSPVYFILHYVDVALILFILWQMMKNIKNWFGFNTNEGSLFLWFASIIMVVIASAEVDHLSVLTFYSDSLSIKPILKQSHKIGYPIVWGLCSFVFMVLGMKHKIRDLRIISLSLFLVILVKLFMFDIRGISEGGKIAAFISLGVLLLIVSFMYQKLKKLVMKDEENSQNGDDTELTVTEERPL